MKRRPAIRIALDCSCGDTARGRVSPPAAYAHIKAAFLAVHNSETCRVTDLSEEAVR